MSADDTADSHRDRRLARLAFWLALLVIPLAAAAAYWALLRSRQGDYLISYSYPSVFRVEGMPKLRLDRNSVLDPQKPDRFKYALRPTWDGLEVQYPLAPGASGVATEWPWERIAFAPKETAYYLAPDYPLGLPFFAREVEWYPLGSLERVVTTLRDDDLPGFLAAAQALVETMPERVTPRYWVIAGLCLLGEVDTARVRLDAWRPLFLADPTYRGRTFIGLLENDLRAAAPEQRRLVRDIEAHRLSDHAPSIFTLPELIEWIKAQASAETPCRLSMSSEGRNSMGPYVLTKLARVDAQFAMLQGRLDDAHRSLLGSWALALLENPPNNDQTMEEISTLTSIVTRDMAVLYTSAALPAETIERFWPDVDAALARRVRPDGVATLTHPELYTYGPAVPLPQMETGSPERCPLFWKMSEAEIALLREAIRARHFRARHGQWPAIDPATGGLLGLKLPTDEPPFDPFTRDRHCLRAIETSSTLVIYSVGPDGDDDRAGSYFAGAKRAGPTGSPDGDLYVQLPHEPKYRFPLDPGYVYRDAADFDERYPGGLPRDPFAFTGKGPMHFARDGSAIVWSYGVSGDGGTGPAARQNDAVLLPDLEVCAQYDPTNGARSAGDLWVTLPFEHPPIATPAAGAAP